MLTSLAERRLQKGRPLVSDIKSRLSASRQSSRPGRLWTAADADGGDLGHRAASSASEPAASVTRATRRYAYARPAEPRFGRGAVEALPHRYHRSGHGKSPSATGTTRWTREPEPATIQPVGEQADATETATAASSPRSPGIPGARPSTSGPDSHYGAATATKPCAGLYDPSRCEPALGSGHLRPGVGHWSPPRVAGPPRQRGPAVRAAVALRQAGDLVGCLFAAGRGDDAGAEAGGVADGY